MISLDKPDNFGGEERVAVAAKTNTALEISQGHYVIVIAFRVFDNALKYTNQLKAQGFKASCKFSSKSLFYYVYFIHSETAEEGRLQRDNLRTQKAFKDAWYLNVE